MADDKDNPDNQNLKRFASVLLSTSGSGYAGLKVSQIKLNHRLGKFDDAVLSATRDDIVAHGAEAINEFKHFHSRRLIQSGEYILANTIEGFGGRHLIANVVAVTTAAIGFVLSSRLTRTPKNDRADAGTVTRS